jgi:hypothetical protein
MSAGSIPGLHDLFVSCKQHILCSKNHPTTPDTAFTYLDFSFGWSFKISSVCALPKFCLGSHMIEPGVQQNRLYTFFKISKEIEG